jgi:hypothetical protein
MGVYNIQKVTEEKLKYSTRLRGFNKSTDFKGAHQRLSLKTYHKGGKM